MCITGSSILLIMVDYASLWLMMVTLSWFMVVWPWIPKCIPKKAHVNLAQCIWCLRNSIANVRVNHMSFCLILHRHCNIFIHFSGSCPWVIWMKTQLLLILGGYDQAPPPYGSRGNPDPRHGFSAQHSTHAWEGATWRNDAHGVHQEVKLLLTWKTFDPKFNVCEKNPRLRFFHTRYRQRPTFWILSCLYDLNLDDVHGLNLLRVTWSAWSVSQVLAVIFLLHDTSASWAFQTDATTQTNQTWKHINTHTHPDTARSSHAKLASRRTVQFQTPQLGRGSISWFRESISASTSWVLRRVFRCEEETGLGPPCWNFSPEPVVIWMVIYSNNYWFCF